MGILGSWLMNIFSSQCPLLVTDIFWFFSPSPRAWKPPPADNTITKTPSTSCQVLPYKPVNDVLYHPTDTNFSHQAPSSLEVSALVGEISFHSTHSMDYYDLVNHLVVGHPLVGMAVLPCALQG